MLTVVDSETSTTLSPTIWFLQLASSSPRSKRLDESTTFPLPSEFLKVCHRPIHLPSSIIQHSLIPPVARPGDIF